MNVAWIFCCKALATCLFLTYPVDAYAKRNRWRFSGTGFVGSLAGVASAALLPSDPVRSLLVILGVLFLSVVTSEVAEESYRIKDDQRIVIDEWVGYLITIALLPQTPLVLWGGFIVFRLLDTFKPAGIARFAQLKGGWGVVMDDVAAGIVANGILRVCLLIVS
jgi:phosphatidylglycerophosphatase A